jgi:glycosyltransferase involved in cell wall biosynthesis
MKIAINTIPLLSPLTGAGTYIYHIAQSLRAIDPINEYTYFYGYYSRDLTAYYNENKKNFYRAKEFAKKIPIIKGTTIRELAAGFFNTISPRSFDLYFEPNFIPINIKSRWTVVTIFDFSIVLFPEWHPKARIDYFEKNFWKRLTRADRIIVISDYIKKQGVSIGLPGEKITTIHPGYNREVFKIYPSQDVRTIKKKYHLPEYFVLFVGSLEPRKNLKNLITAYISLDKGIRKDIKLVLVGFKGWQNKELMELLKKVKSDVVYLGYLPEKELGKLFNLATLFVYPSVYEGFGLPPLEAMACGCPVVVSEAASLPEVCDNAAYYVDPYSAESIADGMYRVATDKELRGRLIKKGLLRTRLFSWEKAAKRHLEVFEDVAENRPCS